MRVKDLYIKISLQEIASVLFGLLFLNACSPNNRTDSSPISENHIYLPPTPAVAANLQPTLISTPLISSAMQTSTPILKSACVDSLKFISDITISDGTIVKPGEILDKRWKVENNGTCNWDQYYHLKAIAGPTLGAAPNQGLYPARSGTEVTLRILFTAPIEPGRYRSAWQAYNQNDEPFGDPFFIEIVIESQASPTP